MWDWIVTFFTAAPWWELLLILGAKAIEVTLGTLRIILVSKGYRKEGTFLALIEIILWVFIASTVINGMAEAPIKGIMYSFGFAFGVYLGSLIESKIAMGKIMIQIITNQENAHNLELTIRKAGMGLTTWDAHGKESDKVVFLTIGNRKNSDKLLNLIAETDPTAVVAIHDATILKGGYYSQLRKAFK